MVIVAHSMNNADFCENTINGWDLADLKKFCQVLPNGMAAYGY